MFKVGQMRVRGQCIQDKLRVMIIKTGLQGIKLMRLPRRRSVSFRRRDSGDSAAAPSGNTLSGFNKRKRSLLFCSTASQPPEWPRLFSQSASGGVKNEEMFLRARVSLRSAPFTKAAISTRRGAENLPDLLKQVGSVKPSGKSN